MRDETVKPNRRSIRFQEYDYSQPSAYFVTICTRKRECLLGEIFDGKIVLNESGLIVHRVWNGLPVRFPHTTIDSFVVMPNHIHGIMVIYVGAIHESPLPGGPPKFRRRKMLLSKMVGFLKMNTAKRINCFRRTPGSPVWQRNYYEHVIRNEIDLDEIRQYIENNPAKWLEDENHPTNIKKI